MVTIIWSLQLIHQCSTKAIQTPPIQVAIIMSVCCHVLLAVQNLVGVCHVTRAHGDYPPRINVIILLHHVMQNFSYAYCIVKVWLITWSIVTSLHDTIIPSGPCIPYSILMKYDGNKLSPGQLLNVILEWFSSLFCIWYLEFISNYQLCIVMENTSSNLKT